MAILLAKRDQGHRLLQKPNNHGQVDYMIKLRYREF